MGRGLSELQKTMLQMSIDEIKAWHKQWDDPEFQAASWEERLYKWHDRDNWLGYVNYNEVLVKVYGWTPQPPRYPDSGGFERIRFSKKEIGQKQYMAAYIAVYKAAQRLEKRGMIINKNKKFYITEEGKAYLSAKLMQ